MTTTRWGGESRGHEPGDFVRPFLWLFWQPPGWGISTAIFGDFFKAIDTASPPLPRRAKRFPQA